MIGATAALLLLLQSSSSYAATDFVTEIDATVVAMHDYSVLSGQIKSSSSSALIKSANSAMNKQLGVIRTAMTTLDSDLNKNWTYLGVEANFKFPARDVMRKFDLDVFKWYALELKIQKQALACYKNEATSKACVLKVRAKNKAAELKIYTDVTNTLKEIEVWRKAAGR